MLERIFRARCGRRRSSILTASRGRPPEPDASLQRASLSRSPAQQAFSRFVAASLGYDFEAEPPHGCSAPVPHVGAGPGDARTTRYATTEDRFPDALGSTTHEVGARALTKQGLPKRRRAAASRSPEACSLGIHESQSRLWENQGARPLAARSGPGPCPRRRLLGGPGGTGLLDARGGSAAFNAVEPSLIRVDADEADLQPAIDMLRFDLERALLQRRPRGRGRARRLERPHAGSRHRDFAVPRRRARGCLQDVHWSTGLIRLLPAYALGNLVRGAAQGGGAAPPRPGLAGRPGSGASSRGLLAPSCASNGATVHGRRWPGTRALCRRVTAERTAREPLVRATSSDKPRPIYGF